MSQEAWVHASDPCVDAVFRTSRLSTAELIYVLMRAAVRATDRQVVPYLLHTTPPLDGELPTILDRAVQDLEEERLDEPFTTRLAPHDGDVTEFVFLPA